MYNDEIGFILDNYMWHIITKVRNEDNFVIIFVEQVMHKDIFHGK